MVWQKWEDAENNIVELKSGKLKKLYFTHIFLLTFCFLMEQIIAYLFSYEYNRVNLSQIRRKVIPDGIYFSQCFGKRFILGARWNAIGLFERISFFFLI